MSLYTQFSTNKSAETDGVWFPYPQPDGSLVELLLARSGGSNSAYKRELRRLAKKHARKGSLDISVEQYPPALNDVIAAMADHIVKGWRTTDVDGKVREQIIDADDKWQAFSIDQAKVLLRIADLRVDIQLKSADYRNYQDIDPGEIEGN